MKHIFLSYSRKNVDVMQKVRDYMRANGFTVWTDEALVPGTTSWMAAIENALEVAACLVVILSPDAKSSRFVREEMNYAEAHDVRIFPVLAEGNEATAVPFGFITAQRVDLRKPDEFEVRLQHLVSAIRNYIGVETQQPEKSAIAAETNVSSTEALPPIDLINLSAEAAKAVEILRDSNSKWWRRADAARRLGQLGDAAVIPILEAYLDNPDLDVRSAAAKAINQIRNPGQAAVISKLASSLPVKSSDTDAKDLPIATQKDSPKQSNGIATVKIVVTGSRRSGKTEFIRSMSEIEPVSTKTPLGSGNDVTSVELEFGRITIDEGLIVYMFGTPGQRRFDFMWEILAEGMLGFIVMVNSTRPETFREARSIIETFRAYSPAPYVIAASFQDHPDAWDTDNLRLALGGNEGVKLLPCVAKDPESVKSVFLELIYSILENIDSR